MEEAAGDGDGDGAEPLPPHPPPPESPEADHSLLQKKADGSALASALASA